MLNTFLKLVNHNNGRSSTAMKLLKTSRRLLPPLSPRRLQPSIDIMSSLCVTKYFYNNSSAQYFASAKKYGSNKKHWVFLNSTTPCIYYILAIVSHTRARASVLWPWVWDRERSLEFYLPIIRRCPSEAHQQQTHTHTLAFLFIAGRLLLLYYFSSFITHSFNWSHRVCVSVRRTFEQPELLLQRKNVMLFT